MPANPITPPPAKLPQLYQRRSRRRTEWELSVQALGSVLTPSEAV